MHAPIMPSGRPAHARRGVWSASAEPLICSSSSRRLSRRIDRLDDLDAAVGAGQRVLELGPVGDPPVRRPGGRAEAGQVDAVRGAEQLLVGAGVLRRPLLERGEDRAAVVVGHHDREVGPRLVAGRGPGRWRRAGRSRRRRSAIARVLCGRPSAAPMALETVPSMPARPRLASTIRRSPTGWAVAIRSRSRIGLLAPTTSRPPGGLAALTAAATSYGVRPGCSATKASMRSTQRAVRRAPLLEPAGVVRPSARDRRRARRRPGTAGPASDPACAPRRPRRRRAPAAAAPAGTGSGGRTRRPARSGRRARCRAAAGRCGSGSRPVRDPLLGSASSGHPACSASTRAGGPASSPATTTVRGPGGSGCGVARSAPPRIVRGRSDASTRRSEVRERPRTIRGRGSAGRRAGS